MIDDDAQLQLIQDLSSLGDEAACEDELLSYIEKHNESVKARILLCGLLFSQDRLELAKPYALYVLERIELEPHCSLALFFILWDEGSKIRAMNVIDTYLANSDSKSPQALHTRSEFKAIKKELRGNGL